MSDARKILDKLEREGDDGILWFEPTEIEDEELSQLLELAQDAHFEYENAVESLKDYINEVLGDEDDTI